MAMAVMALAVALLVAASWSVVRATSNGYYFGTRTAVVTKTFGYSAGDQANECDVGPAYWCLPGQNNINKCQLDWVQNIGNCGYSSGVCKVVQDISTFCATNADAFHYNGGLTNLPPGYFGWLLLAMYWPPSACPSDGSGTGFCSPYTAKGMPAASTFQLHGMWPDFGSSYGTYGAPANPGYPSLSTAYEGWPQYCSSDLRTPGSFNYTQCHVNGNLCPLGPQKSQTAYDNCMAEYQVEGCFTQDSDVTNLLPLFPEYAAGYLGSNGSFLSHEFTKHGSCVGGYLTVNKTAFYETALDRAMTLRSTSYVIKWLQNNRGRSVPYTSLQHYMNNQAVAECNDDCTISEIWFCFGRDAAGYPTNNLIECGPGNYASDTCNPAVAYSSNCSTVIIPDFTKGPYLKA